MTAGVTNEEADRTMKGISPAGYKYLFTTEWGRHRGIGAGLPMDMSDDAKAVRCVLSFSSTITCVGCRPG